jgi:hypothetical protein
VLGAFAAARDVTKHMQAREREQLIELHQFQRLTVTHELKITELMRENQRLRALLPGGGAEPRDQR